LNLYLRLLKLLLILPFVRRRGVFEPARITFRVWPTDCDLNVHMNNGRYLTFMDLGRIHLIAQTGVLSRLLLRQRLQPMLAAAEISFVRALGPLQRFVLTTRVLAWDEKYFYIEQRFERAGTLRAVAIVKALFIAHGRRLTPAEVLTAVGINVPAPAMPEMLRHWNRLSALKKEHVY